MDTSRFWILGPEDTNKMPGPAGGTDRAGVPDIATGHFQALAATAPRPPGAGAARGASSSVPAQSGAAESGGFVARAVPGFLAGEFEQPQGVRGNRVRERTSWIKAPKVIRN